MTLQSLLQISYSIAAFIPPGTERRIPRVEVRGGDVAQHAGV